MRLATAIANGIKRGKVVIWKPKPDKGMEIYNAVFRIPRLNVEQVMQYR